jgi:hypothetical protein
VLGLKARSSALIWLDSVFLKHAFNTSLYLLMSLLVDGYSLSNNILVRVHHISDARVLQELHTRQIRIPVRYMTCYYCKVRSSKVCAKKSCKDQVLKGISKKTPIADVSLDQFQTAGNKRQRLNKRGESSTARAMTSPVCMEVILDGASTHETREKDVYVTSLRRLLVERLKDEEEFERLTIYARDVRYDANGGKPKWELGRLVLDMLHCPMRMNEKVLCMLYFAVVNRCGTKRLWAPLLDELSAKVRLIGSLPPSFGRIVRSRRKLKTGDTLKGNFKLSKCPTTCPRKSLITSL